MFSVKLSINVVVVMFAQGSNLFFIKLSVVRYDRVLLTIGCIAHFAFVTRSAFYYICDKRFYISNITLLWLNKERSTYLFACSRFVCLS